MVVGYLDRSTFGRDNAQSDIRSPARIIRCDDAIYTTTRTAFIRQIIVPFVRRRGDYLRTTYYLHVSFKLNYMIYIIYIYTPRQYRYLHTTISESVGFHCAT